MFINSELFLIFSENPVLVLLHCSLPCDHFTHWHFAEPEIMKIVSRKQLLCFCGPPSVLPHDRSMKEDYLEYSFSLNSQAEWGNRRHYWMMHVYIRWLEKSIFILSCTRCATKTIHRRCALMIVISTCIRISNIMV